MGANLYVLLRYGNGNLVTLVNASTRGVQMLFARGFYHLTVSGGHLHRNLFSLFLQTVPCIVANGHGGLALTDVHGTQQRHVVKRRTQDPNILPRSYPVRWQV